MIGMSKARLRFLKRIAAHEADFAARKAAGLAKAWESRRWAPRGLRGFTAAANAAERDGLVIVYRTGPGRLTVDAVVLTEAGREAAKS
jgi:hypothetical protein